MKKLMILCLCVVMALSLIACGGENTRETQPQQNQSKPVEMNVEQTYSAMLEAAQLPEMQVVDESMLLDLYGIDPADTKQLVVAVPATDVVADELWLIEAKDAQAAEKLKGIIESRIQAKAAEWKTYGTPDNLQAVENAEVLTSGNYLVMVIARDAEPLVALLQDMGM